jgi:hypothetical protein
MDVLVTYSDKNGTEKFDVVLGEVQTNEKFHYKLFSMTEMLLKGYKLDGNKHSLTLCNKARLIVFDIKTLRRYLINYPYLSDYGQTIFCLSFPSRDRATASGQCE